MMNAAWIFQRSRRTVALLLAFAGLLVRPATAWEYWIGIPDPDDWVHLEDVAIDSSGDVIVAGTRFGETDWQTFPFLRRLSSSGMDVWSQRSFQTAANQSIHLAASGEIVLLGVNYAPSSGRSGPFLQKVSTSNGDTLWGGPDPEMLDRENDVLHHLANAGMAMLPNDDILMLDSYRSESGLDRTAFIRRISGQTGLQIWERQSNGKDLGEIAVTHAGTFISAQQYFAGTSLARFAQDTGQWLNSVDLYQAFHPKLVVDPNGDLFVISDFYDDRGENAVEVRKLDEDLRTLWRTVIQQDAEFPNNSSSPNSALDAAGNVVLAYSNCQDNTSRDCTTTTLSRVSGTDGTVTRGPTLDVTIRSLKSGPSDTFIVAGYVEPGIAWVAGFNSSTFAGLWERRFGGPEGNAQGAFEKIAVQGDAVVGVGRIFSRRVVNCSTCRMRDALVARISAVDGSDSQPCGNGVLDETEQCDDGNKEEYDFCPSRSSNGCRFAERLARTLAKSPARDTNGCKVGWYVADSGLERDRYGLRRSQVACHDNDPWCDFDPQIGVCGFDVTLCLNNDNPLLPACHAEEISSVAVDGVRLRPKQTNGPDLASELSATVNHAVTHLLDPRFPLAGYTASPPLSSEQRGLCSQAFRVSVPLELEGSRYGSRRVQIAISTKGASTTAKGLRSKLKLACKAAQPQ